MTNNSVPKYPYKSLGNKIRSLREKSHETLAEVSGAVEIDTHLLIGIEKGVKLPNEDILILIIRHFELNNSEAFKLWQLAGYDKDQTTVGGFGLSASPTMLVLIPIDNKVIYTDQVHVNSTSFGITMNFMQSAQASNNSQPQPIARLGMSLEHAKSLVTLLNDTLASQSKRINKTQDKSLKRRKQTD
ncbi:MAG TPA: helix-turn-helix transcriptional regulator [Candidatus Saccharimonadales bacterium]|nr:helix-turn-helix transcriptional regulator [Candidatus Saccharimonadales bacterium]